LETQAESLGFLIDLVVHSDGRKLAIECDGPTHFEGGDGQVYVKDDWERQGALEAAGWNFYRISYFDWVQDQAEEENTLDDFIETYFDDDHITSKTTIFKDLESETVAPDDAPKDMYVTDFSDENVDNVNAVKATSTPRVGKTAPAKKEFSVGERGVDQNLLETYLASHAGGIINVRYQTTRNGSSQYWRNINITKYDDIYFYVADATRDYPIKYRRDRVVEFK
jgi:hypothetical protein